jgi:curved DNA-binding protein CbpA
MCTDRHAGRSYKRLALKYSPRYFPNDPTAPVLWESITKAYNILVDPDRRMFYDAHGNVPAGLEDFDVASIHQR